jgi:UDP-glucose 6-dehydrogenase
MIHDYATNLGADWSVMKKMLDSNIMISKYYTSPMHKTGRGAGGHCFIKDYSAFLGHFSKIRTSDPLALEIFKLIEEKNLELLFGTGKDLELIEKVYGKKPKRRKK